MCMLTGDGGRKTWTARGSEHETKGCTINKVNK